MSCYSEACPIMSTFDVTQLNMFNFVELSLNWLCMSFDDNDLQTLHNTASNGPVWPHLVNGDVWSRIWRMIDLVYIEAEVRNLGRRYQVMANMALWGQIDQIWPKVAYNGPMHVLVGRYDKFWLLYCLHYQFWPISTLSGKFDHIAIQMPSNCKLARNGPQRYYMSCYNDVCPFMDSFDAAQRILHNFEKLSPNWLRMSFDDKDALTMHITDSNCPAWPHLVNGDHILSRIWSMNNLVHIEAEVRNLCLRYQVMTCLALWRKIQQIWPKVAYNGQIYVLLAWCGKFWTY